MQNAAQITKNQCDHKLRDAGATKFKLVNAALLAFSTRGYDASSTRSIETEAGVKRGLTNYHYGSKEALWKATADHLMSMTAHDLGTALETLKQMDEDTRLYFFVRTYVVFCAKHPEINRLMIQEGMAHEWRLAWLLERSVRPWYEQARRIFNQAAKLGVAPKMDAHHFYYALTGAVTQIFLMPRRLKRYQEKPL